MCEQVHPKEYAQFENSQSCYECVFPFICSSYTDILGIGKMILPSIAEKWNLLLGRQGAYVREARETRGSRHQVNTVEATQHSVMGWVARTWKGKSRKKSFKELELSSQRVVAFIKVERMRDQRRLWMTLFNLKIRLAWKNVQKKSCPSYKQNFEMKCCVKHTNEFRQKIDQTCNFLTDPLSE